MWDGRLPTSFDEMVKDGTAVSVGGGVAYLNAYVVKNSAGHKYAVDVVKPLVEVLRDLTA